MKKILIAAATLLLSFSLASAEGITKTQNDAAIKAGHKALVTKLALFEADLKQHNDASAETVVMDILALMRQGVAQVSRDAHFETGKILDDRMKEMSAMEAIVQDYINLSDNVTKNGQQLLTQARAFIKNY